LLGMRFLASLGMTRTYPMNLRDGTLGISLLDGRCRILEDRGEMEAAAATLKQAEQFCRKFGDKDAIATCLYSRARLARKMRNLHEAGRLAAEALRLATHQGFTELAGDIQSLQKTIRRMGLPWRRRPFARKS